MADGKLKQECILVGCVTSTAVSVWGGVCPGVSARKGVCPGRGVCPVHAGIHTPAQCMLGYTHPPVNRMADRCKNITLPQLRYGR